MGRVALAQVRQATFDPSQAIAQLAASRQQARVVRRSGSRRQSSAGQSFSYQPRPLNEESLYTQVASPEERGVLESQNRAQWNADRQRQLQHQQNLALPPQASQILEAAPDVAEDPEVRGLVDEYRTQTEDLAEREQGTAATDPVRRVLNRKKQQLKNELVKEIKNSQIYKEGKKKASEWIWRGLGPIGEVLESEGFLAWTETTFGALVNQFQAWKTVILPAVGDSRPGDPDSGKIFKGFLGFLEPDSLDPKDPATWMVDAPMAAIGIFFLVGLHIVFLEFLTIIGAVLLVMTLGASALGEFGSTIASMLGII